MSELMSSSTNYWSFPERVFPVNQLHTCTATDKLTGTDKTQNTQITQNNASQKVAQVNSTEHAQKKPGIGQRTDRTWFSRLFATSVHETQRDCAVNPGTRVRQKTGRQIWYSMTSRDDDVAMRGFQRLKHGII